MDRRKWLRYVRLLTLLLVWGFLFPELIWNEDTCKSYVTDEEGERLACADAEELFEAVLLAKPGEITARSKLLEIWDAFWKKGRKVRNVSMERSLGAQAPIGVFDSGVGGLTVAREIMRQIPNEKIVYFGDTARVPYGSKSKETVTRFSRQIVRFL